MDKHNKTILIVEDERSIGKALMLMAQKEGFKSLLAKNGEEGFSLAQEHNPDIIVCDIAMPVMDGPTFIKKLKEEPWGKNSYIFMLTNYSDSSHITQMLELGITTYFVKNDVSLEKVLQHIKTYLENSAA